MSRPTFALVAAAAAFGACFVYAQPPSPAAGQANAQGWTPGQQNFWYYTTQGSRLIPLTWLQALEQSGNSQPFLTPTFIQSFGLLMDTGSVEGMPVGFAVDQQDDTNFSNSKLRWFAGQGASEKWVGMTCSACHTAQLQFNGQMMRIDGGPSLFDFQSFIEALDAALNATANDPAKFGRFATKVLVGRDNAANRNSLRGELLKLGQWEKKVDDFNETPLRYGHGRVDAFGHIFNKIALFAGNTQPIPNPSDAPVSYPFLWDIYRQDKLQWNGIVEPQRLPLGNGKFLDYGALGRNTGEVLGVFGDVVIQPAGGFPPHAPLGGYKSSIHVDHLDDLETQLRLLRPPRWPGTLDQTLVNAGAQLFDVHCKGCHQRQPGTQPYKVTMVPLTPNNPNTTDPWMACNAISYKSPTNKLKGTPQGYFGFSNRYGDEAALASMLETTVKGALFGQKGEIIKQAGRIIFRQGQPAQSVQEEVPDIREARLEKCYQANSPYMKYKARPLDGIWATAPYLHNGSVPTLNDLLKPPAQRPTQFSVGTRVYDPVNVGYVTRPDSPGNVFTYKTRDPQGFPTPGNSNQGHDYGISSLTDAQRRALLEYLKSL
jgi:cytochrome c peroxidase